MYEGLSDNRYKRPTLTADALDVHPLTFVQGARFIVNDEI